MDQRHVLDISVPTDPQGQTRISTFTPPMFIEMGDEGSENLEAKVKEKLCIHPQDSSTITNYPPQTGEIANADEDWTRLSSSRSIDPSVVGGFMFQSDAGTGCSIQVTENESLPVRILIDREQDFSMLLVVVLRHEEWTTSGKFYLRPLR